MLQKLKIKNIALIDECVIEFGGGLNTLTGETGAGKSIIIDSLNFVLGARSDKSLIKSGQDTAKVDGVFITDDESVMDILESVGLERDSTIIISRIMNISGKNECRVNGEIVPLNVIKKITSHLVDVFGQNDGQFMLDTRLHLSFLDSYNEKLLVDTKTQLGEQLAKLAAINDSIKSIGGDGEERLRNIDILKYQINEISSANIQEHELDELNERKNVLKNSEKIIEKFNDFNNLSDGTISVVSTIKNMANVVSDLSEYISQIGELGTRLDSIKYEIEDVVESVKDYSSGFEYNENELNFIEERLDEIKSITRKYGGSIDATNNFLTQAIDRLKKLENATEELQQLNAQKYECLKDIFDTCTGLTALRKQIAQEFERKIEEKLHILGMKNAHFQVFFKDYNFDNFSFSQDGADVVEFLFSANLGEPLKPLAKIISGGELSRFMLAFKTVVNNFVNKTYVFDEIDTGISGSVGTVVAKQMSEIALNNQVICITHLAQIASFADNMYKIFKYEDDTRTYTQVNLLNDREKINEITRLIGTGEISDFAYKHAEELIKEACAFKTK